MNIIKSYIKKKTEKYKSYYYKNNFPNFDYFDRFNKISDLILYDTNEEFIIKNKIPFGTNISNINNLIGKCRFQKKLEELNNYTIYYYKFKIDFLKYKLQLHFYNDMLFYAVNSFPYLDTHELEELLNLVKIKYKIQNIIDLPFGIKDKNNNILVVSESVELIFEYFWGNKNFINEIFSEYNKLEIRRQKLIEKRKLEILKNI